MSITSRCIACGAVSLNGILQHDKGCGIHKGKLVKPVYTLKDNQLVPVTTSSANQPDRAGEGELDRILKALLGDYHNHICTSCNGTGCINCRNTGYNQTPCLICDKDGIAFKNKAEAKAAIAAYVDDKVRRELQSLPRYSYPTENNIDREAVPAHVIDQHIAELTAAPVGGQDVEGKG